MNIGHTLNVFCMSYTCVAAFFYLQILSVPSNAGGLRFVGPHFPSGIWRGGAGGHRAQCSFSAEQGATVEDVECGGQPAYRHHHTGRQQGISGITHRSEIDDGSCL